MILSTSFSDYTLPLVARYPLLSLVSTKPPRISMSVRRGLGKYDELGLEEEGLNIGASP